MQKRIAFALSVLLAIAFGYAGYVAVIGPEASVGSAEAREATMPAEPNLAFLGPPAYSGRGRLTASALQERGVSIATDWEELRDLSVERALDALLLDAEVLDDVATADVTWLRGQFRDGVVVVGLGTADNDLASLLGIDSLRSGGEGNPSVDPTSYRIAQALVLGRPDEVDKIWSQDWVGRVLGGDQPTDEFIEAPLVTSFNSAHGELLTEQDLDLLFIRIDSYVRDAYETRADFRQ